MSASSENTCSRCPAKSFDPKNHDFSKCTNKKRRNEKQMASFWPAINELGLENDKVGGFEDCEALLKHFRAGKDINMYQGKKVTKWMMEDAFDTVYTKNGDKRDPPKPAQQQGSGPKPAARPSGTYKGAGGGRLPDRTAPKGGFQSRPATFHNAGPSTNFIPLETIAAANVKRSVPKDEFQGRLYTDGTTPKQKDCVITNYVLVKSLPRAVYKYSLAYGKVTKDGEAQAGDLDRGQKRLIMESLQNVAPLQGRKDWATDCDALWSVTPLVDQTREPVDGTIHSTNQFGFKKLSGKPCEISEVSFTFIQKLNFYDGNSTKPNLQLLVDTPQADQRSASVHKTALNALISQHVTSQPAVAVIPAGPNKFFMGNSVMAFDMLEAHRGYFTSIRPGTENVLLNIGFSTGAFYRNVRVSDFLKEMRNPIYSDYGSQNDERGQKLLRGRTVRIIYRRPKPDPSSTYDPNDLCNRRRVISSFGETPRMQTFTYEGKQMTVASYFKDILRLPEPDLNWPCVNVGVKPKLLASGAEDPKTVGKQVWIPADYLMIESGQQFGRRLGKVHMEQMIKAALRSPGQNQKFLVDEGLATILPAGATGFPDLEISVERKLLSIPATFLDAPIIEYQGRIPANLHHASWNFVKNRFTIAKPNAGPGRRATLGVLDFRLEPGRRDLSQLGLAVAGRMLDHGMSVHQFQAKQGYWSYARSENPEQLASLSDERLNTIVSRALVPMSVNGRAPDFFLVLLDDNNVANYGKIKRVFDQHQGRHTVCLTAGTFISKQKKVLEIKDMAQTFSNLALKFNVKLGGQNHAVMQQAKNSTVSAFSSIASGTMVVGADVSHAPSSMADCPSVASVVASDSASFAQFPGSMRLQPSKQEFIEDLEGMMYERIERYHSQTKRMPERILFYRDGVGEDMYDRVRDEEIKQIRKAFAAVWKRVKGGDAPNFHLTFIIAGKRHNTRFFATDDTHVVKPSDGYKGNANVKPGLIVDSEITQRPNKDQFDFFLLSHQAITGTARPAHYVVLQKGGLTPLEIKHLTYYFCFNFARATKGVSYVAPAYYADRLCERGAQYLKAYTFGRDQPAIAMTQQERADGKEGLKDYQRRVAQHISQSEDWNPRFANGRTNPWHPNMDGVMFWI